MPRSCCSRALQLGQVDHERGAWPVLLMLLRFRPTAVTSGTGFGVPRSGGYGVDAAFMLLEVHESGIHAF
jgi:hypothetical protein